MKTIVVHGATGWMGQSAIKAIRLRFANETCRVVLLGSKKRVVSSPLLGDLEILDVKSFLDLTDKYLNPDIFLQFGFKTRDYDTVLGGQEYLRVNTSILNQCDEIINLLKPKSIGVISSGVVSRHFDDPIQYPLDNYTKLKILEEERAIRNGDAIGATVAIIRLWGSSGELMTEPLKYAIGDLIHQALYDSVIKISSNRLVYRRYCDSVELMQILIRILLSRQTRIIESGGEIIEMGELATTVNDVLSKGRAIYRPRLMPLMADNYFSRRHDFESLAREFKVELSDMPSQILKTAKSVENFCKLQNT